MLWLSSGNPRSPNLGRKSPEKIDDVFGSVLRRDVATICLLRGLISFDCMRCALCQTTLSTKVSRRELLLELITARLLKPMCGQSQSIFTMPTPGAATFETALKSSSSQKVASLQLLTEH